MASEKLIARVGADVSGFKKGMKSTVSIAKSTATKLGLAFAGVMTTAALIGSKFEFELTKTATVAQAFGKDLEDIEKKARELGRSTAFTATQAAQGMYDLASAGLSAKEVIDASEHSMMLAGATGSEMSQATKLVASSLKQFGLEATDTKRITDTYSQAITSSQLTMERLTEAMKYAGTTGAALGWDIEQTTAAVAMFANLGLEGSMAGTNLRMSMLSLAKGAGATRETLEELGMTIEDDLNPEAMHFGEMLTAIANKSMDAGQAAKIFGSRAGLNVKQLAELARQGKLDFEGFTQALRDAQQGAGRTKEMYDRLMDTFRGDWKKMLSASQDLMITFFNQFKNQGREVFRFFTEKINEVSQWIRDNQASFKKFFDDVAVSIKKVGDRIGTWVKNNDKLITQQIPAFIEGIGDALASIVSIFNALPDYVVGSAGIGLLGWMLTGKLKVGLYLAAVSEMTKGIKTAFKEGGLAASDEELVGGVRKLIAEQKRLKDGIDDTTAATIEMMKLDRPGMLYLEAQAAKELADQMQRSMRMEDAAMMAGIERQKAKKVGVLGGAGKEKTDFSRDEIRPIVGFEQETGGEGSEWGITESMARQVEEFAKAQQKKIELTQQYQDRVLEMSVSDQEWKQIQLDREIEMLRAAKVEESIITDYYNAKMRQNDQMTWQSKMNFAQNAAGKLAGIFQQIAQAGGKYAKEAFMMYKVAAIAEATISAALAISKALGAYPPPWNFIMAGIVGAAAAVQVATIASSKPPSYDEGGISTGKGMYYAGVPEAHVPLKNGAIPVEMGGGAGTQIILENPVFQDMETQRATMSMIAETVVRDQAPTVVEKNYMNDGSMRSLIRSAV